MIKLTVIPINNLNLGVESKKIGKVSSMEIFYTSVILLKKVLK